MTVSRVATGTALIFMAACGIARDLQPTLSIRGDTGENMKAHTSADDSRPPWDAVRAASLVGKYVLIGLTYLDANDSFIEQRQLHGTIIAADRKNGFAIKLRGVREGEVFGLPPDLRAFQDARPGE